MAFWSNLLGRSKAEPRTKPTMAGPRAATQLAGGGAVITNSEQLEEYLRAGSDTASGAHVTPDSAMRVAAVYACVRIRAGIVATLPLDVKKRVDERTREDASTTPLGLLLRRRPNRWQTPSQFRRMMQAHVMLRGNAYAMVVRSMFGARAVTEMVPLHPYRMKV